MMNIKHLLCSFFVVAFFIGCKEDSELTVNMSLATIQTTSEVANLTGTSAETGGQLISEGGTPVTACGIVWSNSPNPTVENNIGITIDGRFGIFTTKLKNLIPKTTYYVRAYAKNSDGMNYGNQVSFTTKELAVGNGYKGGVVAYFFQPGDQGYVNGELHGLIAAPSDFTRYISWCSPIQPETSTSLGSGLANTITIVNNSSSCASDPARMCYDLELNGYSDWFLPSKDELNKLFLNRVVIGGFKNDQYWSSSKTWVCAWTQFFGDGSCDTNYGYDGGLNVRAIRYF